MKEGVQPGDGVMVDHSSWRLGGVRVIDAVYPEKGIDSRLSPIDPLILLVPSQLVGTHEATIGDPNNPQSIPEGFDHSGFAEINFDQGWRGPAVAVAAFSSQIYESIVLSLRNNSSRLGLLQNIEYGDLGVLDGHHRRALAEAIKLKYIPIQIIPYPHHPSVVLGTWHSDGVCWTTDQVFACFKKPDMYADAKRTKFQIIGTDNVPHRILHMQPDVHIPLANLSVACACLT